MEFWSESERASDAPPLSPSLFSDSRFISRKSMLLLCDAASRRLMQRWNLLRLTKRKSQHDAEAHPGANGSNGTIHWGSSWFVSWSEHNCLTPTFLIKQDVNRGHERSTCSRLDGDLPTFSSVQSTHLTVYTRLIDTWYTWYTSQSLQTLWCLI